jgi:cell division protein FtsB
VRAEPARTGGARASTGRAATSRAGAAEPVRSANRPAASRRVAGAGAAKRIRAPQPRRLTGRATVLCMLLIGLLLAYAYPVRVYLSLQNEIDQIERSQAAQRQHIDQLAGQLDKWNDPEYIKTQARGRLMMSMPGDKTLLVIDDQQNAGPADPAKPAGAGDRGGPWYGKLWSSVRAADQGAR